MCPMITRVGAWLGAGVAWVFCHQFLAAMALVCFFSASLLCCGMGAVPSLSCGLAYGGGIMCPVFVVDAV